MIFRVGLGMAAALLLAACGDDLESRQSAVEERQPLGGEVTLGERTPPVSASRAPNPSPTVQGFADDEELEEPAVVDAAPEMLVDNAEGFSTDPVDDTSGFDPSPVDSGGFAPETLGSESFEE